jgi:hypothetical protein
MRQTLLTALGSAALLSGAMLGSPADAMTFAAPAAIAIADTDTGAVQVRYYHRYYHPYYHHRYYNYYGYGRPYGYYGRPYGYGVPFIGLGW